MTINSTRAVALNFIRIFAMLAVINLHTLLNFVERPDFFNTKIWWTLMPIVILSAPAVIIFFMLSGYLVLNRPQPIVTNIKKIFHRLLIPLLFFGGLNFFSNLLWIRGFGWINIDLLLPQLQKELHRLVTFPSSFLWFLVVLIFLYLLNPLWQTLLQDRKNKKLLLYLTSLAFLLSFFAKLIEHPSGHDGTIYTAFTAWLGYLGIYLYGGLLRHQWLPSLSRKQSLFLLTFGFVFYFIFHFFKFSGFDNSFLFDWTYSLVAFCADIVIAIGFFNFFLEVNWLRFFRTSRQKQLWFNFTNFLASMSFGIYLLHPFIINRLFISGFQFDFVSQNAFVFNLLNWFIVFFSSLLLTWLISWTPYLRKIIGLPARLAPETK